MKNMMLQVRNCKLILLCTMLLLAVGCKKENNDPLTLQGNKPRPTWLVSDSLDMLSSMTVVVQVTSLEGQAVDDKVVGESDMLAAFVGEECVGVAEYKKGLFFLYLSMQEGEVTLRYYSAHFSNLFEAEKAFVYRNDSFLGTVAKPFTPQWKLSR